MRELLNDKAPISPVSVDVLSMLRTPALANISFAAAVGCERTEREAPVTAETLLDLLLRPETLDTASVKGIVPPLESNGSKRVTGPRRGYPTGQR